MPMTADRRQAQDRAFAPCKGTLRGRGHHAQGSISGTGTTSSLSTPSVGAASASLEYDDSDHERGRSEAHLSCAAFTGAFADDLYPGIAIALFGNPQRRRKNACGQMQQL